MVVLTHDRVAEVVRTVAHTIALPEAPRVVVVDNGSADGTADEIERRFPEVTLVRLKDNRGAAGRNIGISRAGTALVALSDDDTRWLPGSIAHAAELMEHNPRIAVVTGRVLVGDDAKEDPTCAVMAATPLARWPGVSGHRVLGFLAGASMIRRTAFEQAGGFEPRFFLGGEERLLAVDLAAAGWCLVYAPDVVVRHDPSLRRESRRRRRLLLRNGLWFTWLRRPLRRVAADSFRLIGSVRDRADAGAIFEGLAGLRWAIKARRVLPADVERDLRLVEGRRAALP